MEPAAYPAGTVRALLQTDLVTAATRAALLPRIERRPAAPQFFDSATFILLQTICARLIPQSGTLPPVDIAGSIDARLFTGKSNGWRYDALPPDEDAYRQGLVGLEEGAQIRHGMGFTALSGEQQDELLRAVQQGEAPGAVWQTLSGPRFFEELLAESVECYYSDPITQEEIGYAGMADAPGWVQIGLNQREPREPQEAAHG